MFFLRPNVQKLKERRNVSGLIRAHKYSLSPRIRIDAVRALAEIGTTPRVVKALVAALSDFGVHDEPGLFHYHVCWAAARALGGIGDNAAVQPLIRVLQLEDTSLEGTTLRGFAAWALGEIGSTEAIQPLVLALDDKGTVGPLGGSQVNYEAIDALGKIGDPCVIDAFFKKFPGGQNLDSHILKALQELGKRSVAISQDISLKLGKFSSYSDARDTRRKLNGLTSLGERAADYLIDRGVPVMLTKENWKGIEGLVDELGKHSNCDDALEVIALFASPSGSARDQEANNQRDGGTWRVCIAVHYRRYGTKRSGCFYVCKNNVNAYGVGLACREKGKTTALLRRNDCEGRICRFAVD